MTLFKKTLVAILILLPVSPVVAQSWQDGTGYLYLADRLDRPEDGYCLDVAGSGDWVDFNMPLNAHNCKRPGFYADEAVTFASPGQIRFPAYRGCVTVVGINGRSLPGAALMLKPCAEDIDTRQHPYVRKELQSFTHRDDGRIELTDSELCVVVGAASDSTFSTTHRWRSLFMAACQHAPEDRSIWRPFVPETQ